MRKKKQITVSDLASDLVSLTHCSSCHWFLFESGKSRRKTCPKCQHKPTLLIHGDSLDSAVAQFTAYPEAAWFEGRQAEMKSGIAESFERFLIRKEDWAAAEAKAGDTASRGLIARIYKGIRAKRVKPRVKRPRAPTPKPPSRDPTVSLRDKLDWLHAGNREQERKRVKEINAMRRQQRRRKP
jgi:hypothetical protein